MSLFMKAEMAKEASEKNAKEMRIEAIDKQRLKISDSIVDAISKGEFSIFFEEDLFKEVQEELEQFGYTVKDRTNDILWTVISGVIISWKG